MKEKNTILDLEDRIKIPEALLIEKDENKLNYVKVQSKTINRKFIYGAIFTGGLITGCALYQLIRYYAFSRIGNMHITLY